MKTPQLATLVLHRFHEKLACCSSPGAKVKLGAFALILLIPGSFVFVPLVWAARLLGTRYGASVPHKRDTNLQSGTTSSAKTLHT
jgi:hypothetical protein